MGYKKVLKQLKDAGDPRNIVKRMRERSGGSNILGTPYGGKATLPKGWQKKEEQKFKDMKEEAKLRKEIEKDDRKLKREELRAMHPSHVGSLILVAILLILVGSVVGYLMQIPTIVNLFQYAFGQSNPLLNLEIDGVPLRSQGEYMGCLSASLFDPGTLLNIGGIQKLPEICKDRLSLIDATTLGCSDCFDILVNNQLTSSKIVAGTSDKGVVRFEIFATDTEFSRIGTSESQPILPASNPKIGLIMDEDIAVDLEGRCVGDDVCGELDPHTLPISIIGTFEGSQLCSGPNAINSEAVLVYTYKTEGSAPVNLRTLGTQAPLLGQTTPVSLPGPLKMNIIPDSYLNRNGYELGIEKSAFVSIHFTNRGVGEAALTNLKLEQVTPENSVPLNFVECFGPIQEWSQDGSGIVSIKTIEEFVLDRGERSGGITCLVSLEDVQLSGSSASYVIVGEAIYDYKLKKEVSSIIVDKFVCAPESVITTPGVGAGGGGAGQCIVANPDKTCPSGLVFQENGCCV